MLSTEETIAIRKSFEDFPESQKHALYILFDSRNEQPHNAAGETVACFLGDAILYLWRQFEAS